MTAKTRCEKDDVCLSDSRSQFPLPRGSAVTCSCQPPSEVKEAPLSGVWSDPGCGHCPKLGGPMVTFCSPLCAGGNFVSVWELYASAYRTEKTENIIEHE